MRPDFPRSAPCSHLHLFLNDDIPEEHKAGLTFPRYARRAHVLVLCGGGVNEDVKNDIAVAGRLNITATTLEGIITVKQQGRTQPRDNR